MPCCSVKDCGARKSENQPRLTLHKFPTNEARRRKWLDAIGLENINPRHKNWHVCSLHFDKKWFNRTLDVIRLRDDAIPTLNVMGPKPSQQISNTPVLSERHNYNNSQESLCVMEDKEILRESDKIIQLQKTCEEQKKKIKSLSQKVRRRDKKIATLTNVLEDLQKRKYINTEEALRLEECAGPQDFLKRQITKSKGLPLKKKYAEEIRKFALTLHFYSPKAYNFIRNKYNTCLPHVRTLRKWYKNIDAEPGFTHEAFEALKRKADQSDRPLICALIMDEMVIRKGLGKWNPISQTFSGRVQSGDNVTSKSDSGTEATQCLVLLLTCINDSWKLPIGYFFKTALTGEQKCGLIETAIKLCEDINVRIVSLTCDGPLCNFAMFRCLGCNNLLKDQSFTKFKYSDTTVHAFVDPCHALKLIRNTFGDFRLFYDPSGRKIDFIFLERLLALQEKEGLHLANKLSKAHIHFEKQKMKVRLATQLFSSSVADALEHCRFTLKMQEFEDCEGTINFINIMNDVFDVLNSHSIRPPGWKKAMCPQNIGLIRALFESATMYIKKLVLPSGERLVDSPRKTGFIGLIVCMNSALEMYSSLIEEEKVLKYLPLYKVSQDHVELFFAAIRSRGGWNNNPNAVQFRAAYKKLLIRAEIRDEGFGNCVPLQEINILTCSSKNPTEAINSLTEKQSFVEIPEDHSDLFDKYSQLIGNVSSDYVKSVLEHIAGFITKKLAKSLKCDKCVALLIGQENVHSLIYQKSRGGLQYASAGVLDILKKTENLLKPQLDEKTLPENYYLYIFKFLTEFYDSEKILLIDNDTEHNTNHRFLLIKSVIKTYLDLRFRYHSKIMNDRVSFRTFYNKLTLFRNE